MKKIIWLYSALTTMAVVSALAQDTAPASTTAAPASQSPAKPQKTRVKKRVEMNPAATALVKGKDVNVRGQPSFVGEVLGHLQSGAAVTVLEEITLSHAPAGEPSEWCKINMPTNITVWVKSDFIDTATKSVKARRVNLRGGPGENYSILGRLEKGAMISEIRDENGWTAVEAPPTCFAYVAAELLEIQSAPAQVAAAASPAPETATPAAAPTPAAATPAVPEPAAAAPVAPAPTAQTESEQELAALRQAVATEPPPAATTTEPATAAAPAATESPAPRIVTREGFVHKAYNIQSPADYELHDIKNGQLIEYLQPQDQPNFKIYVGTRVTVTGSEVMDQRWPRTPILRVQSVDLMP